MADKKVATMVMSAYNFALAIEKTYREIPFDIVDHVVLVDDAEQIAEGNTMPCWRPECSAKEVPR